MYPRTLLALFTILAFTAKGSFAGERSSGSITESNNDLFEVSVGYNYIDLNGADLDRLHGVNASAFVNITRIIGVGAEFIGGFGSDETAGNVNIDDHRYIYLFGPRLNFWPTPKVRVFGEALMGGVRAELEASNGFATQRITGDAFASVVGGGVDWRFAQHFYWRVLQADYLRMNFQGQENNLRLSTGLVFTFGGKK